MSPRRLLILKTLSRAKDPRRHPIVHFHLFLRLFLHPFWRADDDHYLQSWILVLLLSARNEASRMNLGLKRTYRPASYGIYMSTMHPAPNGFDVELICSKRRCNYHGQNQDTADTLHVSIFLNAPLCSPLQHHLMLPWRRM